MIPVNRPLLSVEDRLAVQAAFDQGWISGDGPFVAEMEARLADVVGVRHAVAMSSGTTACDLIVEALDIGQSDEIVAPAFTIISTVAQAARRGAILRLIDADPETWCMDAAAAASAISTSTKLVVPVHIFGLPVDMDPILLAAERVGAHVIEDAAEALGLVYRGRSCGSLSDAGIYSFYANKTVTGGEGGAVVTNSPNLASRLRSLRNLCFEPSERFVHKSLGFNARMPSLSAALISSQLSRIDQLIEWKRRMGRRYQTGLAGHPWLQLPLDAIDSARNSYWVFGVVLLDDAPVGAKEFQAQLRVQGVDSRRFFCPMNLQPALLDLGVVSDEPMPEAERLWHRGLYLPSGVGTTDDEIDRTIQVLWELAR